MRDKVESIAHFGEFNLIERIRNILGEHFDPNIVRTIGDDTAVLKPSAGKVMLWTVDMQMEDVHFVSDWMTPFQLGQRAIAVNLSDIAAMGGEPKYILISLALPKYLTVSWVEEFYLGVRAICNRFGVTVLGGNISSSHQKIVIDVTVLGEAESKEVITRDRMTVGDKIYVSGELGKGIAGYWTLKNGFSKETFAECVKSYLTPEPRIFLGKSLTKRYKISGMIDLSDGLIADLDKMCQKSNCGAILDLESIPIHIELNELAKLTNRDALQIALESGDEYELLFTVSKCISAFEISEISRINHIKLTQIGEIIPQKGLYYHHNGQREKLNIKGWDHFQ